jgi:hypothetical protein
MLIFRCLLRRCLPGLAGALLVLGAAQESRGDLLVGQPRPSLQGGVRAAAPLPSTPQESQLQFVFVSYGDQAAEAAPQGKLHNPRTTRKRREAREELSLLQQYSACTLILFGGYYSPPPTDQSTQPVVPQAPQGNGGPTETPPSAEPGDTNTNTGGPQPEETPEPATLLTGLLGAGIVGVCAWRRRCKGK